MNDEWQGGPAVRCSALVRPHGSTHTLIKSLHVLLQDSVRTRRSWQLVNLCRLSPQILKLSLVVGQLVLYTAVSHPCNLEAKNLGVGEKWNEAKNLIPDVRLVLGVEIQKSVGRNLSELARHVNGECVPGFSDAILGLAAAGEDVSKPAENKASNQRADNTWVCVAALLAGHLIGWWLYDLYGVRIHRSTAMWSKDQAQRPPGRAG